MSGADVNALSSQNVEGEQQVQLIRLHPVQKRLTVAETVETPPPVVSLWLALVGQPR
jgi:hypothetical protein